jgi:hypothetical protein
VLENRRYNGAHDVRTAQFYLFECEDDFATAEALFDQAAAWARARHLETLVGPKGFAPLDGYGFLVDGYEARPATSPRGIRRCPRPRFVCIQPDGDISFR